MLSFTARLLAITTLCSLGLLASWPSSLGAEEGSELGQRLERFRAVEEVMAIVEEHAMSPVDRESLWAAALNGMMQALDQHSYYLDSRRSMLHLAGGDGEAPGFGFDWHYDGAAGVLRVRRVIPGSSAAEAGMVAGDVLLAVGERSLVDLPRAQAERRLAGLDDRSSFTLRHADDSQRTVNLLRRPLSDSGVAMAQLLPQQPQIGLVRLSRFIGSDDGDRQRDDSPQVVSPLASAPRSVTARDLRRRLQQLEEQGLRGLIVDLRGNGGGSIPAAVEVADCFLSGSAERPTVIARQRGRSPARNHDWHARGDNTLPPWPLVVLINEHTASAAEVLAAALQEHHRAVLVGSNTQGKDSVQQTFYLDDNAALRLTVARYQPPSGRNLGEQGVAPDISVPQSRLQAYHLARRDWLQAQGEDLPQHLTDLRDEPLQRAQEILHALLVLSPGER